jgi:hypothetical protein
MHILNEDDYSFTYTMLDSLIDQRATRFGPLATTKLIGYLNKCVVGDMDTCEGLGAPIGPAFARREMSENEGG